MTRGTVTGDTRMGKIRGSHERSIRVANVAILSRWYMKEWFSVEIAGNRAESTIVTTFTTTGNARMYTRHECRQCKTTGTHIIVTLTAFSLCRDMIKRLGRCDTRVMAGCTITAHYIQIMYKCSSECTKAAVDVVAIIAIQVGRYMIKSLA